MPYKILHLPCSLRSDTFIKTLLNNYQRKGCIYSSSINNSLQFKHSFHKMDVNKYICISIHKTTNKIRNRKLNVLQYQQSLLEINTFIS